MIRQEIIEDTLNQRIYHNTEECKRCGTIGKNMLDYKNNTVRCRECGHVEKKLLKNLETKPIKESERK